MQKKLNAMQPQQDGRIMGMSPEDYSKKLRETAQKVRDVNSNEIELCQQMLDVINGSEYDDYMLPTIMHNFILLAPKYRFALLKWLERLLHEVRKYAVKRCFTLDAKAFQSKGEIDDVLKLLQKDKTDDVEPDRPAYDISEFLSAHFCAMVQLEIEPTPAIKKLYSHIREYMSEYLKVTIKEKNEAIANCDKILSKKLAGEE